MTGFKRAFPFILYLIPFAAMAFVQSTAIILPTSDDTSAFVVENADNTTVFSAAGDGDVAVSGDVSAVGSVSASSFYGDGSTLSNVRPVAAYAGGNLVFELTYAEQVVKYVQLEVPCAGVIIVNASGNGVFKSTAEEAYRVCITPYAWIDYNYLLVDTQEANPDVTDQYKPFALTRGFTVNSAGTYRYNLVGDLFSGDVVLHDVSMTAMFFPTAGAGAPKIATVEEAPIRRNNNQSDSLDIP